MTEQEIELLLTPKGETALLAKVRDRRAEAAGQEMRLGRLNTRAAHGS